MQDLIERRVGPVSGDGFEGDTEGDPDVVEREAVWERHQRKKMRLKSKHVLTRGMIESEIPALFASRRSDGGLNGFHCNICRRDVSFLAHGEREIYRHFVSKRHYEKDRKYRFDHEAAIFLPSLERVPVELVDPAIVAEIRSMDPVVLGDSFPLVEDSLGDVSGVSSKLPVETLLGTLFELLRSGGSHSLVRRLWSQFRTTLGDVNPLRDVTWSKTEVIVSMICNFGVGIR